jgi:hypothetical protein
MIKEWSNMKRRGQKGNEGRETEQKRREEKKMKREEEW